VRDDVYDITANAEAEKLSMWGAAARFHLVLQTKL
jgi:hypothetical protein